jgi:hypothetical protein
MEVVVAYFNALRRHSFGGMEEKQQEPFTIVGSAETRSE